MKEDINDIVELYRELFLKHGVDLSSIEKQLPPHFLTHELERKYGIVHCPPIEDNESDADYFMRLMEWSEKAKEVPQKHERWKLRHMNGLRLIDCRQRIIIVLEELLNSDFLRSDWFDTDIPKEDLEKAEKEIHEQGLEKVLDIEGACWKFALLNEFRKPGIERIVIIEEHAGQYIREMHDRLSNWSVDVSCRFVAFLRIVYLEIDRLARDDSFEECCKKMIVAIKPLKSHVTAQYTSNYDNLLNEIMCIGNLQNKIKEVSPNTFKGGYNQKLTCNLVGLLCCEGVYNLNSKQADTLIYKGKTHYTYINNYKNFDSSDSELSRKEVKAIQELIKKHT